MVRANNNILDGPPPSLQASSLQAFKYLQISFKKLFAPCEWLCVFTQSLMTSGSEVIHPFFLWAKCINFESIGLISLILISKKLLAF
jgi:hypothetical protein